MNCNRCHKLILEPGVTYGINPNNYCKCLEPLKPSTPLPEHKTIRGHEEERMNIYLIKRDECDYDEYDAFVIAAKDTSTALEYIEAKYNPDKEYNYSSWPNEGNKTAEFIGTTDRYDETTIILGSFNAG